MRKLMLLGLVLFLPGCVEHLIFIRILPSGDTEMTITSTGDSTDIYDEDFLHPLSNPWHHSYRNEKRNDETVRVHTSNALLRSEIIPLPDRSGPGIQTYDVTIRKKEGWFMTTYHFQERFGGRGLYIKSPRLANALGNNEAVDSTQWETEALNYIFQAAVDDLEKDTTLILPYGMSGRLKTHLTNYLAHVEALQLYAELSRQPEIMLREILAPFLSELPDDYLPRFRAAMRPYEQDISTSYHLNDDRFTVALILPGQVYSTNADTIAGDTLKWTFTVEAFVNDDLILEAASVLASPVSFQKTVVFVTLFLAFVFFIGWKLKK